MSDDLKLRTASESVGWLNSVGPLSVSPKLPETSLSDYYQSCAIPKVRESAPKRFVKGIVARLRSRKKRQDDTYAAAVRDEVAARDGYCRYGMDVSPWNRFSRCQGPSEWAHFGSWKRFKTRGLPPEQRHCTAGSLSLCKKHHSAYDEGRLLIIAKSDRLCDGPLRYREIGQ